MVKNAVLGAPSDNGASDMKPLVIRVEDAARLLGVTTRSIYNLMYAGEIESVKLGRSRRFVLASIEAYLARQS